MFDCFQTRASECPPHKLIMLLLLLGTTALTSEPKKSQDENRNQLPREHGVLREIILLSFMSSMAAFKALGPCPIEDNALLQ